MPTPGYLLWDDGTAETLPFVSLSWRKHFSACLINPLSGEVMVRWGWGPAGRMTIYSFHPADRYCNDFEDDSWWPSTSNLIPAQVFRRIFLYFCDEAQGAGLL
jgi:hypothetical protein